MSFSPLKIHDIAFWLDAASLPMNDNDRVEYWTDISQNQRTATSSGTARPTFKVGEINGRNALRFSPNNYMTFPFNSKNDKITMFAVVRDVYKTFGGVGSVLTNRGSGGSVNGFDIEIYNEFRGTFKQLVVEGNGFSGFVRKNNTTVDTYGDGEAFLYTASGSGSTGSQNWRIGAFTPDTFAIDALIGEMILYDRILGEAEISAISEYLNGKWKLY